MWNRYMLLAFSISQFLFAQQDYKGKLVDAKTGKPIPYVNIGIVEKSIGTVSDEEGLFHIPLTNPRIQPNDTLVFSALGYKPIQKLMGNVELVYNEYPIIRMHPSEVELDEVVVSDKARYIVPETIGYSNKGEEVYGYWKDKIAFGGELGTRVVVKRGLRRLDKFIFEVWYNPSDSLLLRVNVYDDNGPLGRPKTNLNKSGRSVLCTVKKNDLMVEVDLQPFEIYVENDFIISLELLKIYGEDELGLVLAAVKDESEEKKNLESRGWTPIVNEGNGSYRKYSSQDKWEHLSDLNMSYTVESSRISSEKSYLHFIKREGKKKKKNKKKRFVTGFVMAKGEMISEATVFNHRTKVSVISDDNGRFKIAAEKDDLLGCTKEGFQRVSYKVSSKPTVNIKIISL